MAIDITPFLTPYTPPGAGYSPTGPYGRHLVAATERFAGLADKRRAQELEDAKFRLQQEKQAETKRSALAQEVQNRRVLGESKRSSLARESDASLTQTRMRRKQAATLFKAAQAADRAGDHEASRILLSIAGYKQADELQSPAEVSAAVEGLGEVVANSERQAQEGDEPGVPLTPAEKREKLGLPEPPPLAGMEPGGPLAAPVPRETLAAEGAPPSPTQAPAPPMLPGQMPVVTPPPSAGQMPVIRPPATYDPGMVPAGMAPPGVSREQYLVDQRAQEPAYAQQPALPALPGQPPGGDFGLADQASPVEQAGADMVAADRAPEMRITTPFGETFDYNPEARNAEVKGQVRDYFQRYVDGAEPIDAPAAMQVRDTADSALAAHGGDAQETLKFLDKVTARHEKEIHADKRKRMGVEAAMALADAKKASNDGYSPQQARLYKGFRQQALSYAKSAGHHENEEQMVNLNKAIAHLTSGDGHQIGSAIGAMTKALYGGHASDKDMAISRQGIMSALDQIKTKWAEIRRGTLDPKHINSLLSSVMTAKEAGLKIRERIRGEYDRVSDASEFDLEAKAWRLTRDTLFSKTKSGRTGKDERYNQATEINRNFGMLPPRLDSEVYQEAQRIREEQGDDAATQHLEEAGVPDYNARAAALIKAGLGAAP